MKTNTLKMVLGFGGGVAMLVLVALQKRFGYELGDSQQLVLIAAIGSFTVGGHGALKTPTKGDAP